MRLVSRAERRTRLSPICMLSIPVLPGRKYRSAPGAAGSPWSKYPVDLSTFLDSFGRVSCGAILADRGRSEPATDSLTCYAVARRCRTVARYRSGPAFRADRRTTPGSSNHRDACGRILHEAVVPGLPGGMKYVPTCHSRNQRMTAPTVNSAPWSERMNCGLPYRRIKRVSVQDDIARGESAPTAEQYLRQTYGFRGLATIYRRIG